MAGMKNGIELKPTELLPFAREPAAVSRWKARTEEQGAA
jgi:hypothetical protein